MLWSGIAPGDEVFLRWFGAASVTAALTGKFGRNVARLMAEAGVGPGRNHIAAGEPADTRQGARPAAACDIKEFRHIPPFLCLLIRFFCWRLAVALFAV